MSYTIRTYIALLFALVTVVTCDAYQEQSKHAQVATARTSQEVACQKHLKRFLDGKDEGLSCKASKARAAAENPLCNLSFSCPEHEAWEMGPDVEGAK